MAKDDWKRTSSLPPETSEIDSSWDDDALDPSLRRARKLGPPLDEEDRPTAVPELPMSELARALMAGVEPSAPPSAPPRSFTDRPTPLFEPQILLDELRGGLGIDSDPPTGRMAALPPTLPPGPRSAPTAAPAGGSDHVVVRSPGRARTSDEARELPTEPPLPPASIPEVAVEVGIGDLDLPLEDFELEAGLDSERPRSTRSAAPVGLPPRALALGTKDPELERAHAEMADRFAVGDFSGALGLAEKALEKHPRDADAQRYATSCREVLVQMYSARLGRLDQTVSVAIPPEQIRWLSLDHRSGFLLSLVDGGSSIEELLDISGMPRLEALRILSTLLEQHVVRLVVPGSSG